MKFKRITAVFLTAGLLGGCESTVNAEQKETAQTTIEPEFNHPGSVYEDSFDDTAGTILFEGTDAEIKGAGMSLNGTNVLISAPGTYVISGEGEEVSITVNSESTGMVHLVLNNTELSNHTESVISIEQAELVIISGYQGTDNTLTSSGENMDAVFSKDDLVFNGSGTINIQAQGDAIHANDDLIIVNAIMNLEGDDTVDVNDTLTIADSILSMTAGKDGIHAGDDGKEESGNVIISGGMISIHAGDDGIDAQGNLIAEDNVSLTITSDLKTKEALQNNTSAVVDETRSKGISLKGTAQFYSGTYRVDSQDDAINSASEITIYDGTFEITTENDGMHADNSLTIQKGMITITAYEGLESADICINDGEINIKASDDGINATDGNSSGMMMTSDGSLIEIHGGNIIVNSDGDGVDSNGDIIMDRGVLTIYGPQNNENSALDYNGSFAASGGTVLAGGCSGMLQSISDNSSLHAIVIGINDDSGTIEIKDADGNTIASYKSYKSYDSLVFASEELIEKENYTVVQNGIEVGAVTISDTNSYLNYEGGRGMQNDFQNERRAPASRESEEKLS